MSAYTRILVPTDGSDAGATAIDRSLDLARTVDASVDFLAVREDPVDVPDLETATLEELRTPIDDAIGAVLDRGVDRADELGVEVNRADRRGHPYRAILEYAEERNIDLVVMGTHGWTGPDDVRLGSTTERVIARSSIPVLAVPGSTDDGWKPGTPGWSRVLIATDGSDVADRAAERGLELAAANRSSVTAVYVVDSSTYELQDAPRSIVGLLKEGGQQALDGVRELAREHDLEVRTELRRGRPEVSIREWATDMEADLIVLGTRGRGGAPGSLMGSTTARILRRTDRPILSVP